MGQVQEKVSVVLVEDDDSLRVAVASSLRRLGFSILEASSCSQAKELLHKQRPDVVVTDLRLGDGDAFDVLARCREADANLSVFIVTGYGSIDLAVRAVKHGAEDFLTKPVDTNLLAGMLRNAAQRRAKQRSGKRPKFASVKPFEPMSGVMLQVMDQIERLRNADCSVLLLGETGTGKSVLARRIHAIGARYDLPFVDVNCAGLSKEFVETELFGHQRGAFTGAHTAKPGLLEVAQGGTLFLDEIGDVDLSVQPKLLKVLEEKRYRRMGEVHEREADVRLIAATHHDLIAAVERKTFRADLYYRIATVTITVPSLRDRRGDIVPLAHHMLGELGGRHVEIADDAKAALLAHDWPGNLRELKNVLERALIHQSDDVLQGVDLRFDTASQKMPAVTEAIAPSPEARTQTLSEIERAHIQAALAAENYRVEAAARRLGIPRSTLYQRIKEYGITRPNPRAANGGSEPPSER